MHATDWTSIDSTVLDQRQPPPRLDSPAQAAAAVDRYHTWLAGHAGELTIADLVTLAATAFRLISIIGQLADPTAWRRCHHNLRLLRTVHPAPAGCTHAVLLAGWTDRQLRGGVPTKPAHPAWTTWTDAAAVIADRLPDLANAAATSLDLLASRRQLLISGPRKDRYRWRAPRTALPAAPRPPQSTLEPHRPGRTR